MKEKKNEVCEVGLELPSDFIYISLVYCYIFLHLSIKKHLQPLFIPLSALR